MRRLQTERTERAQWFASKSLEGEGVKILGVVAMCSLMVGCAQKPEKAKAHNYLIAYDQQLGPSEGIRGNYVVSAYKFTMADVAWAQTNVPTGFTNKAVILNVIKLDD